MAVMFCGWEGMKVNCRTDCESHKLTYRLNGLRKGEEPVHSPFTFTYLRCSFLSLFFFSAEVSRLSDIMRLIGRTYDS